MPDQIRLNIGARILQAVADARLRAEVDDAVKLDPVRDALQRLCVGEIDLLETEAITELAREAVHARLFEFGIVISVKVIDPDNILAAAPEQCSRSRCAD